MSKCKVIVVATPRPATGKTYVAALVAHLLKSVRLDVGLVATTDAIFEAEAELSAHFDGFDPLTFAYNPPSCSIASVVPAAVLVSVVKAQKLTKQIVVVDGSGMETHQFVGALGSGDLVIAPCRVNRVDFQAAIALQDELKWRQGVKVFRLLNFLTDFTLLARSPRLLEIIQSDKIEDVGTGFGDHFAIWNALESVKQLEVRLHHMLNRSDIRSLMQHIESEIEVPLFDW